VDGLNDRADKTDERLKKQKEFFSGPGLVGEHKEESKSLILGTVAENKAELSMVSADDLSKLSVVSARSPRGTRPSSPQPRPGGTRTERRRTRPQPPRRSELSTPPAIFLSEDFDQ